jgi:Family of unknown function (DUF5691)
MSRTMTLGDLALVGTSRIAMMIETGTPIDTLVDAEQVADLAQRVLLTAAALDTYQRAGLIPARAGSLPEPAPADPRRPASANVAAIVSEMIDGGDVDLVPEAFELIAGAGQRLPDPLIPSVLAFKSPDLRRAASAVLGERGRWLAGQRVPWSWAAGPTPTTGVTISPDDLRRTWEEGAIGPRFEAIALARASDPAAAREWIAEGWSREPIENRVRVLAMLQTTLRPDDEPWLESVLHDRSIAVRARAALLLARLPESAFAARARTRVEPLLQWEPATATTSTLWNRFKAIAGVEPAAGTLRVLPPTEADPNWERDGIVIKPPKGLGERSHWLSQLLAQVPPAYWSRHFGVAPRELVRAAWQSEWGTAIARGWSHAITLQGDPDGDWSTALWDGWATAPIDQDPQAQATRAEMLALLFESMPAEAAEARLVEHLRHPLPSSPLDPARVLKRFSGRWSDRLASTVLDTMARSTDADLLTIASARLPPAHFERGLAIALAQDMPSTAGAATRRAIELFITRLRLRQRLIQELAR